MSDTSCGRGPRWSERWSDHGPVSTPRRAHQRRTRRGTTLLLLPFTAALETVADADSVTSDIIFGFAKLRSRPCLYEHTR
jgi:hypothetical protein